MKKFGKKNSFEKGTLMAFACSCRCYCYCLSCKNCRTIENATGLAVTSSVNDSSSYTKSFGPLTILGA